MSERECYQSCSRSHIQIHFDMKIASDFYRGILINSSANQLCACVSAHVTVRPQTPIPITLYQLFQVKNENTSFVRVFNQKKKKFKITFHFIILLFFFVNALGQSNFYTKHFVIIHLIV